MACHSLTISQSARMTASGGASRAGNRLIYSVRTTRLQTSNTRRLHAAIYDLVALSGMSTWWIGRPPAAIAESLCDLLVRVMQADAVRVELRPPECGPPQQAGSGTWPAEGKPSRPGAVARSSGIVTLSIGVSGDLGRLAVACRRPGFPTELERILLQAIANHVEIALRYTALLQRHEQAELILETRAAQQAAVAHMGLRALTETSVQQLLDEAVAVATSTLHADLCEILELADDGESLLLKAGTGWPEGMVGQGRVSADPQSQAGYVLGVADAVLVADLRREARFTPSPLLRGQGVVSSMSVIIHDHPHPAGVLSVHTRTARAFTADHVHFLQSIANLIAAAMQRHQADAELAESLAETQRAGASRDRAVSIVSHDLGNSLSTVLTCVNALLDREPPTLTGVRDMADIIWRSAAWMQQIVQDLLDRTSLDTGQLALDRRPTAVIDLISAAQVMSAPVAHEHDLELLVEIENDLPEVNVDLSRVLQVLSNLLGNAIKFTPPGGRIMLSARVAELGAGASHAVRFEVSDTGPGIAPEDLGHVFDWFWHTGRTGTGLGLAIAAGLVEAHGGRISVASELGRGSIFWFTMPTVGQVLGRATGVV